MRRRLASEANTNKSAQESSVVARIFRRLDGQAALFLDEVLPSRLRQINGRALRHVGRGDQCIYRFEPT